jgi:hypothetical protein
MQNYTKKVKSNNEITANVKHLVSRSYRFVLETSFTPTRPGSQQGTGGRV